MGKKLFETFDRSEAHRQQRELQLSEYPSAECREGGGKITVWSGPPADAEREFARVVTGDLNMLKSAVYRDLILPLTQETGPLLTAWPPEVREFTSRVDELLGCTSSIAPEEMRDFAACVPLDLHPWLKQSFIQGRLRTAAAVEKATTHIVDPDLTEHLKARLAPYEEAASSKWFDATTAARIPQLADYLTLERVDALSSVTLASRSYDEKFHLLQAPDLLHGDLDFYRQSCHVRGRSVCLAFLDVDDFKQVSSQHGEAYVDRSVLPKFMAALERAVFARGWAYRFGGDEYALVLPNADDATARQFFTALQHDISRVEYPPNVTVLTVSIGFVVIPPGSFQTNRELLELTVKHKKRAKDQGKNRVCGQLDGSFGFAAG